MECQLDFLYFRFTQVILIGDAPPNEQSDIDYKRKQSANAQYWSTTPFSVPTHWESEAAELNRKGIPVHTFYVAKRANQIFQQIASRTSKPGKPAVCEELDPTSIVGAQRLRDLVCERVAYDVGVGSGMGGQVMLDAFKRLQSQGFV